LGRQQKGKAGCRLWRQPVRARAKYRTRRQLEGNSFRPRSPLSARLAIRGVPSFGGAARGRPAASFTAKRRPLPTLSALPASSRPSYALSCFAGSEGRMCVRGPTSARSGPAKGRLRDAHSRSIPSVLSAANAAALLVRLARSKRPARGRPIARHPRHPRRHRVAIDARVSRRTRANGAVHRPFQWTLCCVCDAHCNQAEEAPK
jgi:hypothetical protein